MTLLTCLLLAVSAGCTLASAPYISGGSNAALGEYPWVGSVQYMFGKLHECGSAIISDSFILTAAHCIANSPFARHLIAGLYDTNDWTKGLPEKHHFYSVQKHPDFEDFKNDLSVIELHAPVLNMSNPYIGKIAMAPAGADYEGLTCYIAGWGATKEGSKEMSGPMQKAEVTVLSNEECKQSWGDLITDGHICVSKKGTNIGTCGGDSGAPLMCHPSGGWELAGVASFGSANCDGSKPSVFTRVSYYRDWIKKETGF